MTKSTSPSDLARLLLRAGCPTLIAVVFLGGLATTAWSAKKSAPVTGTLEDIIIESQLERSSKLGDVDVLIAGDSSALKGVDAPRLSEQLGNRTVESLALIGFVGPTEQVRIATRVQENGHRIGALVFLLNAQTLGLPEVSLSGQPFEAWARDGHRPRRSLLRDVRDFSYDATVAQLVSRPLPGAFAYRYGFAEDLVAAISAGHGTLEDPNHFHDDLRQFQVVITSAIDERLRMAGEILRSRDIKTIFIGITPLPASCLGPATEGSRERALEQFRKTLRVEVTPLTTPVLLPDDNFATFAHLNTKGRAAFTEALRSELAARL